MEVFEAHKKYMHQHIDEFKLDNATFKFEFKTQCEIIRRFDAVISAKSSKTALEKVEKDAHSNLQKEVDRLSERCRKAEEYVNDEVKRIFEKTEAMDLNIAETIDIKLRREKIKKGLFDTDTATLTPDVQAHLKR